MVRFHVFVLAPELRDLPQVVAQGRYDHGRNVSHWIMVGFLEKPEGDADDVEGVGHIVSMTSRRAWQAQRLMEKHVVRGKDTVKGRLTERN